MKLETFQYRDHITGWELERLQFFPDLTLLVGVSGVGKTRILQAIRTVKGIAEGNKSRLHFGVEWEVAFKANNEKHYIWSGAFESKPADNADFDPKDEFASDFDDDNNERDDTGKPRIIKENLTEDGKAIIVRTSDEILLRDVRTPKLSPYQSALRILNQEEEIATAYESFGQLLFVSNSDDDPQERRLIFFPEYGSACQKHKTIESLRKARFPTEIKLAIAHANMPDIFALIIQQFMSVFPQVEAAEIRPEKRGPFSDVPVLTIKEKGSSVWIPDHRMSSGMLRTLMHLARIHLYVDGTVILIDEFENSLGINCLDVVTEYLNDNSRRFQFIITSHHPYVINNIAWKCWKVVTRKGSVVSARTAEELGFDVNSRHQAFLKLINLEAYNEGIAAQ